MVSLSYKPILGFRAFNELDLEMKEKSSNIRTCRMYLMQEELDFLPLVNLPAMVLRVW